jgi:hypothetical protein
MLPVNPFPASLLDLFTELFRVQPRVFPSAALVF